MNFNAFNQFSYPIFVVAIALLLPLVLRRILALRWRNIMIAEIALISVAVGIFLLLSPKSEGATSISETQSIIQNGQPTFIQFFSDYCSGCLAMEPSVETLTSEIESEFNIIRVNIHTELGRDLRRELDFSFTPEFVLFNAQGQEVWRGHTPPSDESLTLARMS